MKLKKILSIVCCIAVLGSIAVIGSLSASAAGYTEFSVDKAHFSNKLDFKANFHSSTLTATKESASGYEWQLPTYSDMTYGYAWYESNPTSFYVSGGDGIWFPGEHFGGWFGGSVKNAIIRVTVGVIYTANSSGSVAKLALSSNNTTISNGGSLYSIYLSPARYSFTQPGVVQGFFFEITFDFVDLTNTGNYSISLAPPYNIVIGDLSAYFDSQGSDELLQQGNALLEQNNQLQQQGNALQQETNSKLDELVNGGSYDQPDGSSIENYENVESQLVGGQSAGLNQASGLFRDFTLVSFVKGLGAWVQVINVFTGELDWLNALLVVSLALGVFAFVLSIASSVISSSDRSRPRPQRYKGARFIYVNGERKNYDRKTGGYH